jgi:hypothetical protein
MEKTKKVFNVCLGHLRVYLLGLALDGSSVCIDIGHSLPFIDAIPLLLIVLIFVHLYFNLMFIYISN